MAPPERIRSEVYNGRRCPGQGTKDDLATLNLRRHRFHGEWNYTIRPNT